jgi:hypothetical protein
MILLKETKLWIKCYIKKIDFLIIKSILVIIKKKLLKKILIVSLFLSFNNYDNYYWNI